MQAWNSTKNFAHLAIFPAVEIVYLEDVIQEIKNKCSRQGKVEDLSRSTDG